MAKRPALIAHMAKDEAKAEAVIENQNHIKNLPYDGVAIRAKITQQVMAPETDPDDYKYVDEAELRASLEGLKDLNSEMRNYLLLTSDKPGDLFDDVAWARAAENFRLAAKVAKEVGFEGILFDNEEYAGFLDVWQNFPDSSDPEELAEKGYTLEQYNRGVEAYQNKAVQRGREIMEAINAAWPDSTVILPHGPYISDPKSTPSWDTIPLQSSPKENELSGPFFTGFAEGKGANQTLVDGGELYAQREEEDFIAGFEYRSKTLVEDPGRMPWDFSASVRSNWDEIVEQGSYLYTEDFRRPMNAAIMTEIIAYSLRHSEGAVVVYSDAKVEDVPGRFSFYLADQFPEIWREATKRGLLNADAATSDEKLVGTNGDDVIAGVYGNDTIDGMAGNDFLRGGIGADVLNGGIGIDTADYDGASMGVVADLINSDINTGDAAGDTYKSIENLRGSLKGDDLRGNDFSNEINGQDGDDIVMGRKGNDSLTGGKGDDTIVGGNGNDIVKGGAGKDHLVGGAAKDWIAGEDGDDVLYDANGNNALNGGAGNDAIYDGDGASVLVGEDGNDLISGGSGNDLLLGGAGADTLDGGFGSDTIWGNSVSDDEDEFDLMTGGGGADIFVFAEDIGSNRITDFQNDEDRLFISSDLTDGEMNAGAVVTKFGSLSGGNAVLNFGGGNVITLEGVSLAGLADDLLIIA